MFSHFRNIDTAFRHIRTFSIVFLLANVLVIGFGIYKFCELAERQAQRIYILYNGKLLEAMASDKKSNLEVELRYHIKTFHGYFFNLSPDDKAIRESIGKALYLADESAKKQYDNLRESGYYNRMVAANVSQQLQVDSIRLDIDADPYGFICYATQKLVRASGISVRRMVTRGRIRDLGKRTDNNSNGFLIMDWQVTENAEEPRP
ncbi:MAG: conjugative transposon protein TraK [Pedobacter sp.]|nr:MAG: conjugative transposon protein TraK [Pedobacter sp.]